MTQFSLFTEEKFSQCHGGEGKRKKVLRPLCTKRPLHFVLKARRNFYEHKTVIEAELTHQAKLAGIRIYEHAVSHDHLHFVARIYSRVLYKRFIRALTGILARRLGTKLWALLPFSRIAHWGKDFRHLKRYLAQNREEAAGRRDYQPREDYYREYRGAHSPS